MILRSFLSSIFLYVAYCVVAPTVGFSHDPVLQKIADTPEVSSTQFVKVFDVLDSGYRDWGFPAFGLIFVAIGIVTFVFPKIIRAIGIPYLDGRSRFKTFYRYGILGFALVWTAIAFIGTYSAHLRHKALAQENRCRVAEGPVEQFIPMPDGGHGEESFSVDGVKFRYSDFIVTDGFNNTSSQGGPINGGSYVRICYDPAGNVILRLEIRDFKGSLQDYSKGMSFVPNSEDARNVFPKNAPIDLPWYMNLFVYLFIADFIATQALFLPYLRTFFRLKPKIVRKGPILMALEARRRIKLRNSTIYWDVDNHTIWLRPRGFNRFQVPLMVAALEVDAQGKSIIGYEIRFSSGFPFVMMLFFWTAFRFFSATMPHEPNLPLPALFVGFGAVFFIVVSFFKLRIYRSRMEKLIEDALSGLRSGG